MPAETTANKKLNVDQDSQASGPLGTCMLANLWPLRKFHCPPRKIQVNSRNLVIFWLHSPSLIQGSSNADFRHHCIVGSLNVSPCSLSFVFRQPNTSIFCTRKDNFPDTQHTVFSKRYSYSLACSYRAWGFLLNLCSG